MTSVIRGMALDLPLTAFEQAVIVAIFAVLLIGMAGAFYKILSNLMKDFQDFIQKRDNQWQTYFEKREDEFGQRNNMVVESIKGLTMELRMLKEQNMEHIEDTSKAIAVMEERTRPVRRRSRTTKAGNE